MNLILYKLKIKSACIYECDIYFIPPLHNKCHIISIYDAVYFVGSCIYSHQLYENIISFFHDRVLGFLVFCIKCKTGSQRYKNTC